MKQRITGLSGRLAAIDKVKAGLQKIKDLLPGSPIKTGPLGRGARTSRAY